MQPLARDGYTTEQVREVLQDRNPIIGFGCDLLDANDQFVEDISADVTAWSVERSMYADVHATADFTVLRTLDEHARLRPWFRMSNRAGTIRVRFDQGVFIPVSPDRRAGSTPQPIQVGGVDKMWLLDREVGDTYVVESGVSFLQAIRDALTAAGVDGSLMLDGTRQETLLDQPAVWLLTDEPATWLRVVNDLLAMIGYRGMWADEQGRFRSRPYRPPTDFGAEWTFDLANQQTNIVHEDRELSADLWHLTNWWRFVRRQATKPVEDNGLYTVDHTDGLADWEIRPRTMFLDAADQEGLVTQGDAIVAEDTADTQLLTISTGALPAAGHFDIVEVLDAELVASRCQARRWRLDGVTGRMEWELEVLGA